MKAQTGSRGPRPGLWQISVTPYGVKEGVSLEPAPHLDAIPTIFAQLCSRSVLDALIYTVQARGVLKLKNSGDISCHLSALSASSDAFAKRDFIEQRILEPRPCGSFSLF